MVSEKDKQRLAQAVNYEITENNNVKGATDLARVLAFLSQDDEPDENPQSDD